MIRPTWQRVLVGGAATALLGLAGAIRAPLAEGAELIAQAAPATATPDAPVTGTADAPTPAAASPASEVPGAAVAPPTQNDRLDEIEQLARVAARKQEILEEEIAKRAKEAPRVGIDDRGFSLALPDKSYVLKIKGLVQADGRFFVDNNALAANDTFLVRRFRPTLDGTLFSLVDFRLTPELAGTPQVLDAYADLHPWSWLRLRVGKFKAPIGLERLQSDADRAFLEQALVQNLSSQRDVGVQLWGEVAGGFLTYAIAILNGAPDTTANDPDLDHAKDFQGRLFIQPFKLGTLGELGNLGIGLSAGTGNRKGRLPTATAAAATGLSPFRTTGQSLFFSYLAPATDTTGVATTFTHERATRLNPQLYYYNRSFGLLAEYLWLKQGVQKGNATAELKQQSAAGTASVTVGGTDAYDGPTPDHPLDAAAGGLGALQLAARWSWLAVDDATFPTYANPVASARSAQAFGGVVTWVPRRSLHYSLSFEQTRFKGGAGTAASGMTPANITDRLTENVIIGRAQVSF